MPGCSRSSSRSPTRYSGALTQWYVHRGVPLRDDQVGGDQVLEVRLPDLQVGGGLMAHQQPVALRAGRAAARNAADRSARTCGPSALLPVARSGSAARVRVAALGDASTENTRVRTPRQHRDPDVGVRAEARTTGRCRIARAACGERRRPGQAISDALGFEVATADVRAEEVPLAASQRRRVGLDLVNYVADKIAAMVNDEVERIREALVSLCEPLHDAFAWADQLRQERLVELDGDRDYGWLCTHFTRGYARRRLATSDLGPWKLCGTPARNGELWLNDGTYAARVLHTLDDEHVPPPGVNPPRVAFYHNPPLDVADPLFGPANSKMLILWHIDNKTGVPVFRVVRPIGNWKFGDRAKIDLDFILPQTADDLADLQFQPTDEGMELEIPDEKEGGMDVGGSAG